jgi:sec-independent protein translocase protein TatA
MFGLGATELAIILVIVVILFGARRLPEIGSGVGKAIKNFKAGVTGDEIDVTPEKDQVSERSAGNGSDASTKPKQEA